MGGAHYSTDIAFAWQALQAVAGRKHWQFSIASQEGYDSGPLFWCEVIHGKQRWYGDSRYLVDDDVAMDSLPLAICRAALKAAINNQAV